MHNVVKWSDILWKSCGVHTARFLKYVWLFYNIIHERVNNVSFVNNIYVYNSQPAILNDNGKAALKSSSSLNCLVNWVIYTKKLYTNPARKI